MSKSLFDGIDQNSDTSREASSRAEALSHSTLELGSPSSVVQLQREIARLTEENIQLKEAYKQLEERNGAYLGKMAERHIADILGGNLAPPGAAWDITTKHGKKMEVKYATASSRNKDLTCKWRWTHIFGKMDNKEYDILILIGSIESYTSHYYTNLSDIDNDYIYFSIPFGEIQQVMYNLDANAIDVNVRPPTGKRPPTSHANKLLFGKYRVSRAKIIEIHG